MFAHEHGFMEMRSQGPVTGASPDFRADADDFDGDLARLQLMGRMRQRDLRNGKSGR